MKFLEVFLGDTCNLKCVTCGPELNTTWRHEVLEQGLIPPPRVDGVHIESLVAALPSLEEVKFVGGEPLLNKNHLSSLKILASLKPEQITLTYNTNGTVWPDAEVLTLWPKFKQVNIWLSIDGFGELNDYVRFPSKWSVVSENLARFIEYTREQPGFQLGILCTVSLYNIFGVAELEKWFSKLDGVKYLNFRPLAEPKFLSIRNLPEDLKLKALAGLDLKSDSQRGLAHHIQASSPTFDGRVVDYIRNLDRVRGVQLKNFVPELQPLLRLEQSSQP